jgi:hypothetical protein
LRRDNGSAGLIPIHGTRKSTLYAIRKTMLPPAPTLLSSIVVPDDMYYNNTKQKILFSI